MFNTVLLLEDDSGHAMLIKRAMRELATHLQHASTVQEALAEARSMQPDLVISDLRLPDSQGVAHIAQLLEASGGAPIVVLTSSTSLEDAIEALKLGARDFIVKNFNTEFKDMLTLALSRLHATLQIERERRELLRALELLRMAIESSADPMAVIAPDGAVSYSNSAFKSLATFMRGSAGSLTAAFGAAPGIQAVFLETLASVHASIAPGAVWHSEFTLATEPEQTFELSLSAMELDGGRGECVLWIRDITERRRKERFQREILSTTTHDLKGPIGAISISAEMLENSLPKGSREREIAIRIGSASQGVLHLIEEFLSARRIQEGSLLLRPLRQDVSALLSDVMGDYESIAAAKAITLLNETESSGLEWLIERAGIGRVLGNLISNALKFTPKGGVVTVKAFSAPDGLHLRVSDTGSGMEPSDVQRIFERFSRLERHSEVSGSGLGLYVVKSIVQAYGGRVDVTSQLEKGTCFDVVIPEKPPLNERGELVSLDFA